MISSGGGGNVLYSYESEKGPISSPVYIDSKTNMQGLDVFGNPDKMPNLKYCNKFIAQQNFPELKVFVNQSEDETDDSSVDKPGEIWQGNLMFEFSSGNGTEKDPYIIETGSQLAYAISSNGLGGKYFKLNCDIYLNDTSEKNWKYKSNNNEWVISTSFDGHIDGNGKIVYGIWFPKNTLNTTSGLVSVFSKGSIKNIGVRNSQICGITSAGGIVGETTGIGLKEIDCCFVDETVNVEFFEGYGGAGGILGYASDNNNSNALFLKITNCYSKARIKAPTTDRANGIIGTAWRTAYSISDCYSVGVPLYQSPNSGTITSLCWNFVPSEVDEIRKNVSIYDYFADNYSDICALSEWEIFNYIENSENMRGDSAKEYMSGLDYDNVYQLVAKGTPKLKAFESISGEDISISYDSEFFDEGNGTKNSPYIIKTLEQLRFIVDNKDTRGKYYKLGNDIYINDVNDGSWMDKNPVEWYSHGDREKYFAGHLDGDGHTVFGLYMNENPNPTKEEIDANFVSNATALFPFVDTEASIRNLHIRNSQIIGRGCVSAVVGMPVGDIGKNLTIVGCSVDETVTIHGFTVGSIVAAGDRGVNLFYSYSTAKLSNVGPKNRLNGLIGDIWGTVKINIYECYTVGYTAIGGPIATCYGLYGDIEQNYTEVLSKNNMYGDNAKKNMPLFDWKNIWFVKFGTTPQLKNVPYGYEPEVNDEGVKGRAWSGKIATRFASGTGVKNDPYIIETPEQLAYLLMNTKDENTYYKLNADIVLNDTSAKDWQKTAKEWFSGYFVFRGHFNGNGHIISGLYFNNYKGEYAGLFPMIGHGSTIEKLGIVHSHLVNINNQVQTYAGAFVGCVEHWQPSLFPERRTPKISECFADDTVYIEAEFAGGIVAGSPTKIALENCYFTGELTYEKFGGGLVGNAWCNDGGVVIKNCYCATVNRDKCGSNFAFNVNNIAKGDSYFENVYVDGTGVSDYIKSISVLYMTKKFAKERMLGFDWQNTWMCINDGTPVLKCFAGAEKYSCKREPSKVEIAFVSQGGSKCESIFGYPGYTEISDNKLPVPTRYGYKFEGWYYFSTCDVKFNLTKFPNYDIFVYAKWSQSGFSVDFEGNINETYDINSSAQHFKPGLPGYNPLYVHSGLKSMKAEGTSNVKPVFLLSYENTVEIGKEYIISFWMTTSDQSVSGSVNLLHASYGDVNDEIVGHEMIAEFSKIKKGEWKKYEAVFTANSPYLLIETPTGCTLFFDDILVTPTGKSGELGRITMLAGNSINNVFSIILYISIPIALAAFTCLTIFIIKKAKIRYKGSN